MLILIVIAAAVTLAAFVASYEQQYDAEQAHVHQVQLESIRVVGLVTALASHDSFAVFNFTMASSDVDSIAITDITINGFPLIYYAVDDLVNRSTYLVTAGSQLIMTPDEEVTVALDLTPSSTTYSFVSTNQAPIPTSYATIAISTFLGNQFEQSFLPPTAVALVSVLTSASGNTVEQIPLLDGSDSFQPGGNATIVSWVWTVTQNGTYVTTLSGEEAELTSALTAGAPYTIELVVTSSDGLVGSTVIQYIAP